MPYRFEASNEEGDLLRGTLEASSESEAMAKLGRKGLTVVSVERVGEHGRRDVVGLWASIGRVKFVDRLIFTKHMSIMLKAGMTIIDSLQTMAEQTRSTVLRRILEDARRHVERGGRLSDALEDYPRVFSGFYVNVVRAGEVSGSLEENLDHLATQFAKDYDLRKKVKSALMYPTVVIVAAALIGFFFATFVLPQVAGIFSGLGSVELPLTTRVLLKVSEIAREHTVLSFVGLMGSVGFLLWFVRRRFLAPVTHWIILHMPIVAPIAKDINMARFSLIISTLLRSGIDILRALEVTESVMGNVYYQVAIADIRDSVHQGQAMWKAMAIHEELFPPIASRMVGIGEKSGELEEVLEYLNQFYELEVESTMKNLASILEPVLLLVIGLVALGLAFAILMPIYNYISAIGSI